MRYKVERHTGRYNLSARGGAAIRYIAVHYTGAQTPDPPHALNNCQYFAGGVRPGSADYFIDNATICQYNPDIDRYYTWHVGDGGGRYGITNRNSVGIEVCQMGDRPFTSAEVDRLADLVGHLMRTYGVPASRVVRHWDASRKLCPEYYANRPSAWAELHERIAGGGAEYPKARPGQGRPEVASVPDRIYRAYNPGNGDHILVAKSEYDSLSKAGWKGEGEAFRPMTGMVPVYRLYNPNSGEHFYTASVTEASSLADAGWAYEGIPFYGLASGGVPVYRLRNPNAPADKSSHHFTKSESERDSLRKAGWVYEGIAWRVLS